MIDAPNITLEGVSTGVTIKGGTNPISTFDNVNPSGAKNVTIRNVHFEGWNGVAIYHVGVQDETNFTLIEGNAFNNTAHPEWLGACGIEYSTSGGSAEFKDNTFTDMSSFGISVHTLALHSDDHILISGNTFTGCILDAIEAELWDPWAGDLDNGPVIIRNNKIHLNDMFAWGVDIGGWYYEGISNVVVEGNIISGYGNAGITSWPYGHNRKIINNDLSGLTTMWPNIFESGRGDLIANNVLGATDPEAATAYYGAPFPATGIWVCSVNPPWRVSCPTVARDEQHYNGQRFPAHGVEGLGLRCLGQYHICGMCPAGFVCRPWFPPSLARLRYNGQPYQRNRKVPPRHGRPQAAGFRIPRMRMTTGSSDMRAN